MVYKFEDDITVDNQIYYMSADVINVPGQRASKFEPGIAEGWLVEDIKVEMFDDWYSIVTVGDRYDSGTVAVLSKMYNKIVLAIIEKMEAT